jgi:hypothetical protein
VDKVDTSTGLSTRHVAGPDLEVVVQEICVAVGGWSPSGGAMATNLPADEDKGKDLGVIAPEAIAASG